METFLQRPPTFTISPVSKESLGVAWGNGAWTQAGWPSNGRCILIPFNIFVPITIQQIWAFNGGVVAGNMDLGVYTYDFRLLNHTGIKKQEGTHRPQIFPLTIDLSPGTFFMAMAMDISAATIYRKAFTGGGRNLFCFQQNTSFPLPQTITNKTALTSANIPLFGLSTRSFL